MGMFKFMAPRNMRQMIQVSKVSGELDKNMKKRCAYCDKDYGLGDDTPVIEFLDHMVSAHSGILKDKDVELYRKIIKKLTG